RIERRMGLHHINSVGEYLTYLREHPEEIKQLNRDLLISVTSFFRDPEMYRALTKDAIAPLIQAKNPDATIRVWVPGCATGKEVYSFVILLFEEMAKAQKNFRLQVFGTDLDEAALDVGRLGIYPDSIEADVSPERLRHYFLRTGDHAYQVNKAVRECI